MISHVSKSQLRTPNQLGDIASDIFQCFFKKKNWKLGNGMSQPFKGFWVWLKTNKKTECYKKLTLKTQKIKIY